MTPKEQLFYLLEHYYKNDYKTKDFVDQFEHIYGFEINENELSKKQNQLFRELSEITKRFSPFEEDLKMTKWFLSEDRIKEKATEVYLELKKLSDGLHGELYTEDGWIAKYSKYPKEE